MNYKSGPVLIRKIAEEEKIPLKFLEAILLETKRIGIANSKRGKGGGYYLVKPPAEINLLQIIRGLDGAIALLPCAALMFYEGCTQCEDEKSCGIRSIFRELREQTAKYLQNVTLADVLEKEEILQGLNTSNRVRAS